MCMVGLLKIKVISLCFYLIFVIVVMYSKAMHSQTFLLAEVQPQHSNVLLLCRSYHTCTSRAHGKNGQENIQGILRDR